MNIIADTCFWISLCDPTESDHDEIMKMMDVMRRDRSHRILVPHPVLYETLRTNVVKKPEQVMLLIKYFNDDIVIRVPDNEYVDQAYTLVNQQAERGKGTASMVDIVIMLMAEDVRYRVKAILTKNGRDFVGFCQQKQIGMINCFETLKAL